jgi:hypothetical protein
VPWTWGAATSDDFNLTAALSMGSTVTSTLVMGWWYPTTLTATRGLWSAGSVFGAEINSTTSEIRMKTDNTTDGQWTTTGAALATDKWSFLAFLHHGSNTGPASFWDVWMGTVDTAPVKLTVTTATSPAGNHSGSTSFVIGNKGSTGTLAFQGDIAHVLMTATNVAANETMHPFSVSSYTTALTAAQALNVEERFVRPYWAGDNSVAWGGARTLGTITTTSLYFPLDMPNLNVGISRNVATSLNVTPVSTSLGGPTFSQRGCPRSYPKMVSNYAPPPLSAL